MEMQPMAAQRSFNAPAPTPIRPGALTVTARVIGRWSYSDS
jgi:hypothetical protein